MEPLRHARTRFRLTKTVLLACEQFMKHVWHCTRNGFSARKLPAERSPKPNVLYLSSGMRQGAQTTVFVVPEKAMALKLRVSSSENSHRSNHCIRSVWVSPSAEIVTCVVPNIFSDFVERWKYLFRRAKSTSMRFKEAASKTTVFVVSERRSVLNVRESASGMAKVSPNHCIRSA